ncbi:MAG: hypothetical protein KDB90_13055 [Planctomycetes bacterium]|nr:hypothetical protein [Planctomycetota bacterium]
MALAAFAALLVFPSACKQVTTETLHNNANKEGTDIDPAEIARDAGAAFDETPRTLERVRLSSSMYARALDYESARSYEALWKAARTEAWLAEYSNDNVERERHANLGITYANTALKLKPDAPEATFYHGVLAGFIGDLDHDFGLDAVKNIESDMKLLMDADKDIANGGPWRAFGVLQLRAPGPPVSIGSLRNGKKNLETALEKSPEWPENHLYMAEAEFMWAKEKDKPEFKDQARERLDKYLLGTAAAPPAGFGFEFAAWQEKARALLDANK